MKKYRNIRLLALLMAMLLLTGCSGAGDTGLSPVPQPQAETALPFSPVETQQQPPKGMVGVTQNDRLTLYVDEKTACIAVYDRASGQWFYSNPVDAKKDSRAGKTEKNVLMSQLSVSCYQEDLNLVTFYSAQDAVAKDQFTIEGLQDGLRVTYHLGTMQPLTDLMPRYITPERMQTMVYDRLPEKDADYIRKRYINSTTHEGFLELPPATRKSNLVAKKLAEYFVAAGYTWEDQAEDNRISGYEMVDNSRYITVPLEYRLREDHLSVQLLVEQVESVGSLNIAGFSLLPYFGAGSTEDDGYLMIPGGSGALIHFNNGKSNESVYQQQLYGPDPATQSMARLQNSQAARLPVFGVKRNDSAFLAVISQGEAEGYVNADVSGRKNSYNYVYPSFTLRDSQELSMSSSTGNEASMRLVEKDIYQGALAVDYYFLDADAGYSEMAARYRELLVERGVFTAREALDQAPLYLSVIGVIEKTERVLGVPYSATVAMTTCEQAKMMLDRLLDTLDTSVRMRYMGWFNGGVDHASARDVRFNRQTGTAAELLALAEKLEASGGALFLDAAFQYVPQSSGDFNRAKEAVRSIGGEVKSHALYLLGGAPSTRQNMGELYNITTPAALASRMDAFVEDLGQLKSQNFALRDLASALSSDPYIQRGVSRTQAQLTVESALADFQQSVGRLLAVEPNAYALASADEAVNIPEEGVGFYIVDESIPFYPMVLHGMMDYAGTPLNIRADFDAQADLLSMLENGSAPHFMLAWEESFRMNGSVYAQWYSVALDVWLEHCVRFAQAYEEVLLPVQHCTMDKHERLDNGLTVVTYSDGTRVCINNQSCAAAYEGMTIDAMDYMVLKGQVEP